MRSPVPSPRFDLKLGFGRTLALERLRCSTVPAALLAGKPILEVRGTSPIHFLESIRAGQRNIMRPPRARGTHSRHTLGARKRRTHSDACALQARSPAATEAHQSLDVDKSRASDDSGACRAHAKSLCPKLAPSMRLERMPERRSWVRTLGACHEYRGCVPRACAQTGPSELPGCERHPLADTKMGQEASATTPSPRGPPPAPFRGPPPPLVSPLRRRPPGARDTRTCPRNPARPDGDVDQVLVTAASSYDGLQGKEATAPLATTNKVTPGTATQRHPAESAQGGLNSAQRATLRPPGRMARPTSFHS